MHEPTDDGSRPSDRPTTFSDRDENGAEAEQDDEKPTGYTESGRQAPARSIELLLSQQSTGRAAIHHRVAASDALVNLARENPAALEESLPVLVVELRRVTDAEDSRDASDNRDRERTIRANLVETVSRLIIHTQISAVRQKTFTDFIETITTDLDNGALRVATRAIFASADDRSRELASEADLLGELLTSPDAAVQAWAAGTVGRVAATHPDAVVSIAVDLRRLLTHENSVVQHNALEALATFVNTHPDVVAPAADTLRRLLKHDEVGIQHNAAGVLYVLADHKPLAVIRSVEELRKLRDTNDDTVRRLATATLARLVHDGEDAATDSKSKKS